MNAADVVGYTFHAAHYCLDCGSALPDVDPEGNDKHPLFCGFEVDYVPSCDSCREIIDGYTLTEDAAELLDDDDVDEPTRSMTESEASQAYEAWLDEVTETVKLLGLEYAPSHVLKSVDPVAYRVGLLDWCDSEGIEIE